jgi:AbiV family abortive infection protein
VCAENAGEHLAAAGVLRRTGHNNLAFHAAILALEEIGKATLIGMSHRELPSSEPDYVKPDWFEDHAKKLFWALWSVSFGAAGITPAEVEDFRHIANNIHSRRLNAIYVDPASPALPERIPDEEVDRVINLAKYRVEREKHSFLEEMNEQDRSDLNWFIEATDDPKLGGLIFGENSLTHLATVGGNVRQWVPWLRQEVNRLEEKNRALAEQEMSRAQTPEAEATKPKWAFKIRLQSWSHTIRAKNLSKWNKNIEFVKLNSTHDKSILLVKFLLPKRVHVADLWNVAWHTSKSFAVAINVATRGFFWWYVPDHTSKFYEEFLDLENDAPLLIERAHPLVVKWGNQILTERDLEETLLVYAYLNRQSKDRSGPFVTYLQGLALTAKNDIHGQFEPEILRLFYRAFMDCTRQNGDWDGSVPFIDIARKVLSPLRDTVKDFDRDLVRLIALAETVLQGTALQDLHVRDAVMMKLYCDLYISQLALELAGYRPRSDLRPSATSPSLPGQESK